jgi:hypothetical protein
MTPHTIMNQHGIKGANLNKPTDCKCHSMNMFLDQGLIHSVQLRNDLPLGVNQDLIRYLFMSNNGTDAQ